MIDFDFKSRGQRLLRWLGLDYQSREESAEEGRLADYLRLLDPVPEPNLAAGRARLQAEVRSQEEQAAGSRAWQGLGEILRPALTTALTAVFVVTVLYLAAAAAGLFLGAASGHGISNPAPVFAASATLTERPPATFEPTPAAPILITLPQPAATPTAGLAPVPPRDLRVTLTRPAPSKP